MGNFKRAIALSLLLCSIGQGVRAEEYFDVNIASGTALTEAVRAISLRANKNVVISGDLKGTVSLNLEHTTFSQAMDCLAMVNGFTYMLNKNVVLVSPVEKMSLVKTFKIKHLDLEKVQKDVGTFVKENKINVDVDQSTMTVDGTTSQLEKISQLLEKADIAQKQVHVQVTVMEVNHAFTRQMGLDYNLGTYFKGSQGITWAVIPNYEEGKTRGNILASPSVTVFNGKKANILIGDKVPIFTSSQTASNSSGGSVNIDRTITVQYQDVGVKLEVTPRVNDDALETVSVKIKPSVSSISGWYETDNNRAPQISTREAETELRVKSGETIYIGGLLKDTDISQIKAIPFLSKLPFLGELFKRRSVTKEKTEIIIALTPQIVKDVDGVPQFAPFKEKENRTLQDGLANAGRRYKQNRRQLLEDFKQNVAKGEPKEKSAEEVLKQPGEKIARTLPPVQGESSFAKRRRIWRAQNNKLYQEQDQVQKEMRETQNG